MEPREVCKICYNSTSHKPNPTLTFEPKVSSSDQQKTCLVCRQEWAPIRVAKELGSSRWVRIRPRPKLQIHIDFMMCKNLNSRKECPRGQDCSYAHSKAELWTWNQERQKEPRPAPHINGSYQYQLCKYILKSGNCPYGVKCTFAHNEEELQCWLKVQGPMADSPRFNSTYGYYRCNVCQLKCNGKKQLEEHINISGHRQGGTIPLLNRQQAPNSNFRRTSIGQTRPRPMLSFQVAGYRLCVHVQNGRRCLYGDYCTFAHSQSELDEWNQEIQKSSSRILGTKSDSEIFHNESSLKPNITPSKSLQGENEGRDFASYIRASLSKEHKETGSVSGQEVSRDGVSVSEITGTQLAITTSSTSTLHWVFEITVLVQCTLHSVVLFDSLNTDFIITDIVKYNKNEGWDKVPVQANAQHGVGMLLNCKILPSEKLQVKVTMVPRSGVLGQLIVFYFGSFRLLQSMVVRMLTEHEEISMSFSSQKSRKPANVDLFWENHFRKIPIEVQFQEETDSNLPEFALPQKIEEFIEGGKYSNVEIRVTKENYKRRMHNLLYLEEYQQRLDLSRYDLYEVEIKPQAQYTTIMGSNYALPGFHFTTVSVDELLFEGGQSVRHGDTALLMPSNQRVVHECLVEHVGREEIVLKITDKAKHASASSRFRVSLRFVLGRIPMRSMHYAVEQLDLDTIFPVVQTTPNTSIPTSSDVHKCLETLKDSELNQPQLQAITSMLDPSCIEVPSLVLGPFGCGKTYTLSECIKVLVTHIPESCVLVCTHSNSAADIYVDNLDKWNMQGETPLNLFRLYYTGRRMNTIPNVVKKYCKIDKGKLTQPSLPEIEKYKIVVATLSTARALTLMGLPRGHFTHIFIDEAAQAMESECLIPLCMASTRTKIVLAGDHLQLDPPVYSDIARKYGLHVSLLERLYDLEAYDSGIGQLCKTLLTENHRSHRLILDLPSQLFYKNRLSCKAQFPTSGPVDLPPVKFVSVEGQEQQEEDSPSYFNTYEVEKVAEQVQLLVAGGLKGEDVCVLAYYSKQVWRIRNFLRLKRLNTVEVSRVDDVQGKEFRALIISTVRTCSTEPSEKEAGFLTNPKLFNTAVTRARQWLVVVGEPITLCTVGSNRLCWLEYIRRCIGLGSFDHSHPTQFEGSLEYKIITRQLLEKTHQGLFHTAKTVSTQPQIHAQEKQLKKRMSEMYPQQPLVVSDLKPDQAQSRQETFASKVQVMERQQESPFATLHSTSPPPIATPPISTHPSRVTPPRFTPPPRATPSPHRVLSPRVNSSPINGSHPDHIAALNDLPTFLRNMMEAVTRHVKWCDRMMDVSYPLRIASKINENLENQKSTLESQKKLINQQIRFYQEYVKLCGSGVAATSSAKQPAPLVHFPTALPPPSNALSGTISGLSSAFTYDARTGHYSSNSLEPASSQVNEVDDDYIVTS